MVQLLEDEAKKVAGEVISNSSRLREVALKRGHEVKTALLLLEGHSQKLKVKFDELKAEKQKLNRRLDFMLEGSSPEDAKEFREEYRTESARIAEEVGGLEDNLRLIELQAQELARDSFDWQKLGENARKVQDCLQENDPGALKASYRSLFKAIIVGDPDDHGKAELKFILNDDDAPPVVAVTAAENYSVRGEMVVRERLELSTCGL